MKSTTKYSFLMLCLLMGLLYGSNTPLQAAELPPLVDGVLTITVTAEGELYSNYTADDIQATGATRIKVIGPLNDNDILRVRNALNATLTEIDFSEAVFTTMPSFYVNNSSWSLTEIVLPEGLTAIPGSCFYNCPNLTSVNIPSTVTSIGYQAFYNCKKLPTTLTINVSGPLSIEGSAFTVTTNFTAINITAGGDVSIGSYAFTTNALTTFELHTPGKLTTSNDLFSYSNNLLTTVTLDARGAGSTMNMRTFQNCSKLTSVTLPAGLTSIEQEFFEACTALTSITIPSAVTSIGKEAFYGCTALSCLDMSQTSLSTIGQSAFYGCTALTSISLPNSITSLGANTFYNCSSLTTLNLSQATVAEIPQSMCEGCTLLSSVQLPATVTSIGNYAFYNCKALTTLDLSQTTVTAIPERVCYGCESLSTLHLPANYSSIAYRAFYQCKSLTTIDIPSTVTTIGNEAFYQCSGLQTITIPASVTEMGTSVFYQCSALTTANVQANITTLPNSTFYECSALSNVTLPSSLTTLGSSVFQNCWALRSIILPATLTTIGYGAFQNSALTYIDLPASLNSIGSSAFQSCYNLTVLEVPEGITEIPSYMLQGCYRLQSLYLPSTTTSIGERALRLKVDDWHSQTLNILVDVHVAATTPPTVASQPMVSFSNVTLYVPQASVEAYKAANFWNTFNNIYAEQTNLSTLDDAEFALLQSLYTKLGGSNWVHKWTFGATKAETAMPYGVRLNDGHVVQLLLMNNNLSGTLPAELMQFPELWYLDLSGNQISGKVDDLFANMEIHTKLNYLNLNDNQLTGNIGAMRQYVGDAWVDKLPNLYTLKVARNKIRDVKPVLRTHIANGSYNNSDYFDISGQDLTNEVNPETNQPFTFTEFEQTSREDFVDLFPSILAYTHSNSPDYYNCNYVIRPITSSEPWAVNPYKDFYSNSYHPMNVNQYQTGVSTWNYDAPNTLVYLTDKPSTEANQHKMIITFDFAMGDVDYNNQVNVSDLQKLINFAIQPEAATTETPFNFYAANLRTTDDADSRTIDVLDVIAEVNLLLDQDIEPSLARREKTFPQPISDREGSSYQATLSAENGQLVLESELPVAALDLTITNGDVSWSNDMSLFTRKNRGNRTIFYSLMGDVLPAGRIVLGTVGSDAVVQRAQLCDPQGQLITTNMSDETTGIQFNSSTVQQFNGSTVYDLQGRKLSNGQLSNSQMQKGVYIINSKKLVVK